MKSMVSWLERSAAIAVLAVVIVLDNGRARCRGEGEQLSPPIDRHQPPRRILMRRGHEDQARPVRSCLDRDAAAVERDSGGRIKSEVYPASQLGSIPRQIEGVQFGAIQAAVIPPEFFVGIDERFEVMAAPGLVK